MQPFQRYFQSKPFSEYRSKLRTQSKLKRLRNLICAQNQVNEESLEQVSECLYNLRDMRISPQEENWINKILLYLLNKSCDTQFIQFFTNAVFPNIKLQDTLIRALYKYWTEIQDRVSISASNMFLKQMILLRPDAFAMTNFYPEKFFKGVLHYLNNNKSEGKSYLDVSQHLLSVWILPGTDYTSDEVHLFHYNYMKALCCILGNKSCNKNLVKELKTGLEFYRALPGKVKCQNVYNARVEIMITDLFYFIRAHVESQKENLKLFLASVSMLNLCVNFFPKLRIELLQTHFDIRKSFHLLQFIAELEVQELMYTVLHADSEIYKILNSSIKIKPFHTSSSFSTQFTTLIKILESILHTILTISCIQKSQNMLLELSSASIFLNLKIQLPISNEKILHLFSSLFNQKLFAVIEDLLASQVVPRQLKITFINEFCTSEEFIYFKIIQEVFFFDNAFQQRSLSEVMNELQHLTRLMTKFDTIENRLDSYLLFNIAIIQELLLDESISKRNLVLTSVLQLIKGSTPLTEFLEKLLDFVGHKLFDAFHQPCSIGVRYFSAIDLSFRVLEIVALRDCYKSMILKYPDLLSECINLHNFISVPIKIKLFSFLANLFFVQDPLQECIIDLRRLSEKILSQVLTIHVDIFVNEKLYCQFVRFILNYYAVSKLNTEASKSLLNIVYSIICKSKSNKVRWNLFQGYKYVGRMNRTDNPKQNLPKVSEWKKHLVLLQPLMISILTEPMLPNFKLQYNVLSFIKAENMAKGDLNHFILACSKSFPNLKPEEKFYSNYIKCRKLLSELVESN